MNHETELLKIHSQSSYYSLRASGCRTGGHEAGADEKVSIVQETQVVLYDHTCSPIWSLFVAGLKTDVVSKNALYMKQFEQILVLLRIAFNMPQYVHQASQKTVYVI